RLASDGQSYQVKDAPQQFQYQQFQIGPQSMQLRALAMQPEVRVPVGGSAATWLLFPDLPPGNHVPPLVLKLKFGDGAQEIDVNAIQRDVLGLSIQRIGPRKCL